MKIAMNQKRYHSRKVNDGKNKIRRRESEIKRNTAETWRRKRQKDGLREESWRERNK
jgi:hypothetical protein